MTIPLFFAMFQKLQELLIPFRIKFNLPIPEKPYIVCSSQPYFLPLTANFMPYAPTHTHIQHMIQPYLSTCVCLNLPLCLSPNPCHPPLAWLVVSYPSEFIFLKLSLGPPPLPNQNGLNTFFCTFYLNLSF
jgi:hypothetical protein